MRAKNIAFLGAFLLLITGCGAAGQNESETPTATVTETQFVTVSPSPEGAAPTQTAEPTGEPESTDDTTAASSDPDETDGVRVIQPKDAGRNLVLADFVRPDDDWKQNRYNIASKTNITGIGNEISSCGDYGAASLEMRLANNFEKFEFSVGQDNLSEKTDQKLVVRVKGNNKELDVYRVPFNKYQTFDVDVTDVNALTIETFLDEEVESCSGSVVAVFYDIKLQ